MRLGADVEALDHLSRTFQTEAAKIQQAIANISRDLGSAWWEGNDANRFKNQWNGEFRARLHQVEQALQETGRRVQQQATQQRSTSNN